MESNAKERGHKSMMDEQLKEVLAKYEKYMRKNEMTENTIKSYLWTATYFLDNYEKVTRATVIDYKEYLMKTYKKPSTVNQRLLALNHMLKYMHKGSFCVKTIRVQRRNFIDNVISNRDYQRLIRGLKRDGRMKWYMIVRTLICTASRVSELVNMQVEDAIEGYVDIYSKGTMRRIYFPRALQNELLEWLQEEERSEGPLFLNKNGVRISVNGIETMLKKYAREYGIDEKAVHPHSFRHRYAINFLEKNKSPNQLVELSDIMGHKDINVTRLYTRRTASEQYELICKTVVW